MAALEDSNTVATPATSDDVPITNGARRSARSRKAPLKYDDEYMMPLEKPSQPKIPPRTDKPKRRAAEAARERIPSQEVASLQEQVFARMGVDEWTEYGGWVELESEPAFFNAMLQDLDAKTLKVQEVFALDEMTLADLPKPVHGLIFLYQWTNEDESHEARQSCPENLWFGNQTTANACATVALMNIIMNAHAVKFGPELEKFRNTTKPLPPPRRGHALDRNDFIRAIHNSVARRNDLLSEDLLLDNKFEEALKKKSAVRRRKSSSRPRKRDYEPGTYHYIAFVPVDGQVWELDGLENMPLCLGPYAPDAPDTWLGIASNAIQTRMSRQNDEFLSYNLLAVCQSPLLALSRDLAASLATAKALEDAVAVAVAGNPSSPSLWDGAGATWTDFADDRLARCGLTRERILADFAPDASRLGNSSGSSALDPAAARALAAELRAEQAALEARYVDEAATADEAVDMIRARRRDYTPAVHHWVRLLAEKGVLRELIKEVDSLG
ncbi:putative ubiquitin carboxyl-terminal hydrolase protein [Rosellinia necatrix]|uniref:Ubiquitin carboxyl-terminal hydrolase n=1 Tax=Rosellinia necatrix TaxID=77044 RepID=A0A1W2TNC4_ROSNE|nr:putative ubiquitin carboxyl-terminal hydrolase protein [Rosellinia necatrix]